MDPWQVDGSATSVFQPDSLLGFEYFETQQRSQCLDPERTLVLAVLEDALSGFKQNINAHNTKGKRQFERDEAWIVSKESRGYFSFDYICEVLGLNPAYIQKQMKQWKEEDRKRMQTENENHPPMGRTKSPVPMEKSPGGNRRAICGDSHARRHRERQSSPVRYLTTG